MYFMTLDHKSIHLFIWKNHISALNYISITFLIFAVSVGHGFPSLYWLELHKLLPICHNFQSVNDYMN